MSRNTLNPSLFDRDWGNEWDYSYRIMDQCLASTLYDEDMLSRRIYNGNMVRPRTQSSVTASGKSEVTNDDTKFQVSLNVCQFKLEEIKVKVVNNYIEVHGKHEEKSDEHGFVAREFTRRYMLPHNCEADTVTSSLSSNGVLTIVAPKKALEEAKKQVQEVPSAQDAAPKQVQEISSAQDEAPKQMQEVSSAQDEAPKQIIEVPNAPEEAQKQARKVPSAQDAA